MSTEVVEKPHKGRIKNWCFLLQGKEGQKLIVVGDALDHEYMREGIYTSEVVKFDRETGEIETRNSRYKLVAEGDPTPRKGWPNPGDRMIFLNENGHDHERADAAMVFAGGLEAVVEDCKVGDWNHTIKFVGIKGRWNGVMFRKVETSA